MQNEQLGPFRLTSLLGEGAVGTVYQATDTRLDREVAVKVLGAEFVADEDRLARFEREAKVLASLDHPNIARIFEVGEEDDVHFLVMELAPGETLEKEIERGPIPRRRALALARQIADALEAAHARGIVHRDLKPANIKVDADGGVKVLDFGLARAIAGSLATRAAEAESSDRTVELAAGLERAPDAGSGSAAGSTQAGALMGTPAYMSPEQARAEPADARADIWAFGVVLWEMLKGRRLFDGRTVTETLAFILFDDLDVEESLPISTPAPLRRLVGHCLVRDPERRLPHVADARPYLDAAETWIENEQAGRRASRILLVATAVLALVAAVLGILLWTAPEAEPPVVRAYVAPPEGGSFDLDPLGPGPVAVSPDGRSLVFAGRRADGPVRLWVRRLDQLEPRPLEGTEDATYPFWSPDGRSVAFFAGQELRRIDLGGGAPLTICEAADGKGGAWNEEGVIVFAADTFSALSRVPAAGGEPDPLTELDAAAGEDSHRHPRFLPDGERFLYVARLGHAAGGEHRLMLGSLAGDPPRMLSRTASQAESAGNRLFFVQRQTLMAQPFDAERGEILGDPVPVAEDVGHASRSVIGYFSVSPAGVLAYHGGSSWGRSQLLWRDRAGRPLGELGVPDHYNGVELSPDGRQAVVDVTDPETGTTDLWNFDLERDVRTRATYHPANDALAVWSADGRHVAFASQRDGSGKIFVTPVGGTGEAQPLFAEIGRYGEAVAAAWPLAWSATDGPGGAQLVYSTLGPEGADVWRLPVGSSGRAAGEPVLLLGSPFWEFGGELSPDGRWLAYVSRRSGEAGEASVYVVPFPAADRRWQVSSGHGTQPEWSPGGDELFYLDGEGRLVAVEIETDGEGLRVVSEEPLFDLHAKPGFFDSYAVGDEGFLVNAATGPAVNPPITLVVGWPEALGGDGPG